MAPGMVAWQDRAMAELPDDVRALFTGANFAHVATVMPNGAPHSVPVWIGMERERIVFFTQTNSRKARNLEADPRVAISITQHGRTYNMAQVRGRVVERLDGEPALVVIDRLSEKYTGHPFPMRSGVVYLVEPEKVQAMNLPFEHTPA
jgi:PPOX class probable F420-dependent enzyme